MPEKTQSRRSHSKPGPIQTKCVLRLRSPFRPGMDGKVANRRVFARQRVFGVPFELHGLEPATKRIIDGQLSGGRLPSTGNFLENFNRLQRSHDACHRAKHTDFRTIEHGLSGRRFREQTAIRWPWVTLCIALMRFECCQVPIEWTERRKNQRPLREVTSIGNEVSRCKIIRAIGDNVIVADEIERIRVIDPHIMGLDGDMRVEPFNCLASAFYLQAIHIVRVVRDLALKIGERNDIIVNDTDRTHTGGGEIKDHRRTNTAGTDKQDARSLELLLPLTANLSQHEVAPITLDFFRGKLTHDVASKIVCFDTVYSS